MKHIVFVLFILMAFQVNAQEVIKEKTESSKPVKKRPSEFEDTPPNKKSNFFTGGSVSFGLSSYSFNAGLHPHFGYTITNWLDAAVVTNFEYNTQRDQYDNKYHNTTFGAGVFTRIYPVRFAFLQIQPEYNFINSKFLQNGGPSIKTKLNAPSLLLGIGYSPSRYTRNTFSYFTLMIDVLKNVNSPYVDGYGNMVPIIRAGYNIGLFNKKRWL